VAEKDFRVQRGLIVADGDVNVPSDHSVFAGTFDTNVAAAGLTMSGNTIAADGTQNPIDINITPKNAGSVLLTRINDTVIGNITPAAASVTNLTATGTSTLRGAITTGNEGVATTITQNVAAANSAGQNLTITAGSALTGGTNDTGVGGDLILAAGAGKGQADGGDIIFKVATPAGVAGNSPNAIDDVALTISDDKSLTFGGTTNFGSNAMTNVNIDGGTIDGTTIGAGTPSTIAGTALTIDDVVINGKSIIITGDTDDTATIAATTHGALNITTVDTAGTNGNITLNPDGQVRLQHGASTKLATVTNGVNITGNLDISGSLDDVTNITATGEFFGGHADLEMSAGITINKASGDGSAGNKHSILEVADVNFYTSEQLSYTEPSGITKTPNSTFGREGASAGNVIILELAVSHASNVTNYQAAEAFACMSVRDNSGSIKYRVIQKVIGFYADAVAEDVRSTVIFETGDVQYGHFEWTKHTDGISSGNDTMMLIWKWTYPASFAANDVVQFSTNVNGLSLNGAGG